MFVYFYFICVYVLPLCMFVFHICAMTPQCRDQKVTLNLWYCNYGCYFTAIWVLKNELVPSRRADRALNFISISLNSMFQYYN